MPFRKYYPPLPENIILFAGLGGGVVFYSLPALARTGTNLMNHPQGVSIQLKAEPRKRYRSQLRTAGMPPGVPRAGPSLRTRVCAYLSTVSMYPTKIIQQIFCSPVSSFHVYRTHKFAGFTQPKTSLEFDMQNNSKNTITCTIRLELFGKFCAIAFCNDIKLFNDGASEPEWSVNGI